MTPRAAVAILAALALSLAGCGDDKSAAQDETGLAPVVVQMENRTFAPSTPAVTEVESGALVVIDVRGGDGGPFRLSVLAPSLAQTFKIPTGGRQNITLDSIEPGGEVKLITRRRTVKLVAR